MAFGILLTALTTLTHIFRAKLPLRLLCTVQIRRYNVCRLNNRQDNTRFSLAHTHTQVNTNNVMASVMES